MGCSRMGRVDLSKQAGESRRALLSDVIDEITTDYRIGQHGEATVHNPAGMEAVTLRLRCGQRGTRTAARP
jgi:hypothetical protein